jgi:hypothetical protein
MLRQANSFRAYAAGLRASPVVVRYRQSDAELLRKLLRPG